MQHNILRISWVYVLAGLIILLTLQAFSTQSPIPVSALALTDTTSPIPTSGQTKQAAALQLSSKSKILTTAIILVDDYMPQQQGACDDPNRSYNRIDGSRGKLNDPILNWGQGAVTMTIGPLQTWGGLWSNLNHCLEEREVIDFGAILPAQILPPYQGRITGLIVELIDGMADKPFRVELKDGNSQIVWTKSVTLTGGPQILSSDLPDLADIGELVWLIDQASAGDYVVVDRISFTATTQITDTALAAFVWSYGQLLENWNPETGLVRDKAKDSSGVFDAIQATGSLAAATAQAAQLGIVDQLEAIQIVEKISDTLLTKVPRFHGDHGLWPHWVMTSSGVLNIVSGTEWSSIDTAIAAIGLLEAQEAFFLDTSGTISMLQTIDWTALLSTTGVYHGYRDTRELITNTWNGFGGESWLVALVFAAATGQVPPIENSSPPTDNGSGFIDELSWLFFPPPEIDYWGTNWPNYREMAAQKQIEYPCETYPTSCLCRLGLFGLSAAEVPDPALGQYEAFGIGGRFSPPNDGNEGSVAVPHYSAMIASLRPTEAISMWTWLINQGPFSPLNNVESLMFQPDAGCLASEMTWNQLKGSWNLALQTLGWGRYLAQRTSQHPVLWQAMFNNEFLSDGYLFLVPAGMDLESNHQAQQVFYGQLIEYEHTLTNTGKVTDSFHLTVSSTHDWPLTMSYTDTITDTSLLLADIGPNKSVTFTIRVMTPGANTMKKTTVTTVITATSQLNPIVQDTVVHTTTVLPRLIHFPLIFKRWPPIPYEPSLELNDTTDGDSYYSVSWTENAQAVTGTFAITYYLEEASDQSCLHFTPILSSPNTVWTVPTPGKNAGIYCYRVRGQNEWGFGGYSEIETVTVNPWSYIIEGENPDGHTVGQSIQRSNACREKVHGQFGSTDQEPWLAKAGSVWYEVDIPQNGPLYLHLRYSKNSSPFESIDVILNDEPMPRDTFTPQPTGSWDQFSLISGIDLSKETGVDSGTYTIRLETAGQQYGVADLDILIFSNHPGPAVIRCN